jgi:ABC-type nitrate/sulfonate/bicarbonate transport system substrate-binding protein
MNKPNFFHFFLITFFTLTACAAPQPATETTLTPLTFMAGFKPQANLPFVGAYVAKDKGFFEANGLDVTIKHSAGGGEHVQLLVTGVVQVTTVDAANLLQRRAEPGLPLVSIALIGQKGQQAFAALKTSDIESPKDWEGKLVGYKGTTPPDIFALLAAADADAGQVNLVNVGFDPRVLSQGQVDVYPLFKSNEPYLLQQWGYELTLWDAADYGVPTLGLAYVTSADYLATNQRELALFLRSVLQGIAYAEANPEGAVQIVMRYAGPETDPDHMRFMLETELIDAQSEHGYGWQSDAQWQSLADMLAAYDVLPTGQEVSAAFTTAVWELAQSK